MNNSPIKRLMAVSLLCAVVFGNGCDPQVANQILSVVMQGMAMANQIGAMSQMRAPSQGSIVNSNRVQWPGVGFAPQVVGDNKYFVMDDDGNTIERRTFLLSDGTTRTAVRNVDKENIGAINEYGEQKYAAGQEDFKNNASWGDMLGMAGNKISNWFSGLYSDTEKASVKNTNKTNSPVKTQNVKKPSKGVMDYLTTAYDYWFGGSK